MLNYLWIMTEKETVQDMKTGVTVSKSHKRFSTVAAVTGSAAIIALAVAFVKVDFNDLFFSPSFVVNTSAIAALEPIRSDPASEHDGSDNGSGENGDGSGGMPGDGSNDGNGNNGGNNNPDHGEPCLDPNCPIHHGTHTLPCNDPDCPICGNHNAPCGDPDCPICNGHGLPCDDPNCPIHHGDNDKPPVDIKTDDVIRFKPNSYEFVDEAAANAVLESFVESFNVYFERYPDGKIYLVGGIAKTDNNRAVEIGNLSQQRADTVRQSLINLGIDEDRLIAIGIGVNDPWRNDEWADGYFNEEVAKTNRRVWVIPDQYEDQVVLVLDIKDAIDANAD